MNSVERRSQIDWMTLLRYTIPFLPFIAYMLVEINVLPAEVMSAILVVALVMYLGYMLWRLWQGATEKDGRALGHGASMLALGVVLLLHYRDLIDTTLLVYLIFATVGVQWLVERLFLKMWQH